MKKLLAIAVLSFISLGAFAQTTKSEAIHKNTKDLKKNLADVKEGRKERNKDIVKGKWKSASEKQKTINVDRKSMNADKKELKNLGVKHPVEKAKKEAQ